VDVPVVSDADCRVSYGETEIADSMICGGFAAGGKDSCQVYMPRLMTCGFIAKGNESCWVNAQDL